MMPQAVKKAVFILATACTASTSAVRAGAAFSIDPQAVAEAVPLVLKALEIQQASLEREARHREALAKRGIAEVPPSPDERHTLDIAGLGDFAFDEWGEFHIDRRFVTDAEMHAVRAIEKRFAKWFPGKSAKKRAPRVSAGHSGLPVFRGFESARYQRHDRLIAEMTAAFNADKILRRAENPDRFEPIEIKPAK